MREFCLPPTRRAAFFLGSAEHQSGTTQTSYVGMYANASFPSTGRVFTHSRCVVVVSRDRQTYACGDSRLVLFYYPLFRQTTASFCATLSVRFQSLRMRIASFPRKHKYHRIYWSNVRFSSCLLAFCLTAFQSSFSDVYNGRVRKYTKA